MRTKQEIQQTRFGNHIPTTNFKVSDVTVMAPIREGVMVIAGKPACFGNTQHIAVGLHFQGKKVLKLLAVSRFAHSRKVSVLGLPPLFQLAE